MTGESCRRSQGTILRRIRYRRFSHGCCRYPYWVTFKQAQKLGGHVKKGEKATPIVYWHWRTPEEMAKLQAEVEPAPASP